MGAEVEHELRKVGTSLDEIVRRGDPKRLAEVSRGIADLFVQGAAGFQTRHIELFDHLLTGIVPQTELAARAEIAERIAALTNAPPTLIGQLAREDNISIAGPVLRRSPVLDEQALVEIARMKGQDHLLAMTERPRLSPDLTDVMVQRGERDVIRRAAANAGAAFSTIGYSALVKRAAKDGVLTITVGQRNDLPDRLLKELLAGSVDVVRRRLFDMAEPDRQAAVAKAMGEISGKATAVETAGFRACATHDPFPVPCRRPRRSGAAWFCQILPIFRNGRCACRRYRAYRSRRSIA